MSTQTSKTSRHSSKTSHRFIIIAITVIIDLIVIANASPLALLTASIAAHHLIHEGHVARVVKWLNR